MSTGHHFSAGLVLLAAQGIFYFPLDNLHRRTFWGDVCQSVWVIWIAVSLEKKRIAINYLVILKSALTKLR